jgi:hypothetical protein
LVSVPFADSMRPRPLLARIALANALPQRRSASGSPASRPCEAGGVEGVAPARYWRSRYSASPPANPHLLPPARPVSRGGNGIAEKTGPEIPPKTLTFGPPGNTHPRVGTKDPSASFAHENFPPAKAHLKQRRPKFCCQYRHLQTTPRPTSLMATCPVFAHLKRLSLDEPASSPSTHQHPQSLTFGWVSPSRRTLTKQYGRARPRE